MIDRLNHPQQSIITSRTLLRRNCSAISIQTMPSLRSCRNVLMNSQEEAFKLYGEIRIDHNKKQGNGK
jgi:hypothetical protein